MAQLQDSGVTAVSLPQIGNVAFWFCDGSGNLGAEALAHPLGFFPTHSHTSLDDVLGVPFELRKVMVSLFALFWTDTMLLYRLLQ